MTLLFEACTPGGRWKPVTTLAPLGRDGIITDTRAGLQDLIRFRCEGPRAVICRSRGGADTAAAAGLRAAVTLNLDTLAELTGDGDAYELDVIAGDGLAYRARWTFRRYGL